MGSATILTPQAKFAKIVCLVSCRLELSQTGSDKCAFEIYGSPGGTFLLITYHLLLTTYYLSLITYYLLLITYYLSLTTYYLLLIISPGRVAQSVTCLATDASLIADPGVASSISARFHTFVEIDHGIISTVILLPSAESFKKGCYQLQAKVCARSTG